MKREEWKKAGKYIACMMAGAGLYILMEFSSQSGGVDSYRLERNSWGEGDAVYPLEVYSLEEDAVFVELSVPEQKLSKEEGISVLGQVTELLYARILGENPSLEEVRENLNLVGEIEEYGLSVSWTSENPELLSSSGTVYEEEIPSEGATVYLEAELSNGSFDEKIEIPVTLYPEETSLEKRFEDMLWAVMNSRPEEGYVTLPKEFEGRTVSYRTAEEGGNEIILLLGIAAAVCLRLKEKQDMEEQRKKREERLLLDYSDLVSRFIVLTGAGHTIRQAWKKMVPESAEAEWLKRHPVYQEMRITMNQIETGVSEIQAYGEFGRRCGLRCYIRFSSLLQSSLQTGGKNLRKTLESEMEEAFEQRKDIAKRLGEEASTKLLIPLFLMLGDVMVMVVAPAFLTLV